MDTLKPCPFCGVVPELPKEPIRGSCYEIDCDNCGMAGASSQIVDHMTIEEREDNLRTNNTNLLYPPKYSDRVKVLVIKDWNTRVGQSTLKKRAKQILNADFVPPHNIIGQARKFLEDIARGEW